MPDKPGLMRSKPVRGVTKLLRGEISPKAFVELAYQTAFDKPPTTRPVSYSQARQDLFFALLFGERPGTYVDVGARDGVIISNTYALEKHYGWTGVCVEPHPGSFAKLARSRGSRNINAAVADVDEGGATLDFVMWKEGPVGYAGLIDEDFRHTERMKTHAHEVIKVPCLPLHKILSDEGLTHVDVLDIDVEGAEAAVVR
ncbi:MAG: FkbM family methyltransferase, partial [Pseudomonadota bacterium]